MPEVTSEVPAASISNGKISVPIGAVFLLLSGGLGAAAGGGATGLFQHGLTAEQVADLVDDKWESKEEVLEIKLQTINEKLARIEDKLDQIQVASSP